MKRFLRLLVIGFGLLIYASIATAQTVTISGGPLVAVNTTYGTASANTTFNVGGTSLGAVDIVVTPPTGYEVSTSAGGPFTGTVSLSPSSGTVASTPIYARIAAITIPGSYASANVTAVSGSGSASIPTVTSVVSPKPLTLSGITVTSKTYDNTNAATVVAGVVAIVGGPVGSDVFTPLAGSLSAGSTYSDASVGVNKTVTFSGYSLAGPQASRYILVQTVLGDINAKAVTIVGRNANKTYDATASATITGAAIVAGGIVGSDIPTVTLVTAGVTGNFADELAAVGKTVTTTGSYTLSGAGNTNYTVTQPSATFTADIAQRNLTITPGSITAQNRLYAAGVTSATITGTATLTGVQGGDVVGITGPFNGSFADDAASASPKPVTVTGYSLTGSAPVVANYTITDPTTGLSAFIFAPTTVVQNTAGVAAATTIFTSPASVTPVALLGFDVNNPTSTASFTSLSVTATGSNPLNVFSSVVLVRSTGDATYDAGDPVIATGVLSAGGITFSSIGQTITGGATVYHYFVVATLKPFFPTANPSIKLSFAPNVPAEMNIDVPVTSATAISTINGANSSYTLTDNIVPTVTNVSRSAALIFQGALIQTVAVTFSEPMTTSAIFPSLSLSAGTFVAPTSGAWSNGVNTNDTYTATFTHSAAVEETIPSATANISSIIAPIPTDVGANPIGTGGVSTTFEIDTKRPVPTSVVVTPAVVTIANSIATILITYDEAMNTGINPVVTPPANFALSAPTWLNSTQFRVFATHNLTPQTLSGLGVTVTGAQDIKGNGPASYPSSNTFSVDTKIPAHVSTTRVSSQFTSATTVSWTVTFDELVNADINDFQLSSTNPAGGVTTLPLTSISPLTASTTFTITANGIAGEGDLSLLVKSNPSITDVNGNALFAPSGIPGPAYTFDQTPPTITGTNIVLASSHKDTYTTALVNGTTPAIHGNTVNFTVTFSEAVLGVTSSDFNVTSLGGTATLVFASATPSAGPPSAIWTLSYTYSGTGTGRHRLDFSNSFNIQDPAGNTISTLFATGQLFTVSRPEPVGPVGLITPNPFTNQIDVTWTDLVGPTAPTNYLVVVRNSASVGPNVIDGASFFPDDLIPDGVMYRNVAQGVQSASFTGFTPGTSYHVTIYPYSLAANTINGADRSAINYNTTTPARVSRAADIVKASFTYPNNIAYADANNQLNSITSDTQGIAMERFTLRDAGLDVVDDDNFPTHLNNITIRITNFAYLKRLALINDATGLVIKDLPVSSADLVFNSFANPFSAPDNGTNSMTLRATFNGNGVVDNSLISFQVIGLNTASAPSTSLIANNSPLGVLSALSGDNNRIEVTATTLDFTSYPVGGITINQNYAPIVVEARDANDNRDLDFNFTPTITNTNVPLPIGMANLPAGSFVAGVLTFPINFQFTTPPDITPIQIRISAGSILNQLSPDVDVSASKESTLTYIPASFPTRINYIYNQATDLTFTNSVPLATLRLTDGAPPVNDVDGADTKLRAITFDITTTDTLANIFGGSNAIRQIALYNEAGLELDEQTLGIATSVTFTIPSAVNYITAADNNVTTFTVRVSFNSGATNIRELDNIQLRVTNVQLAVGSEFNPAASVTSGSWTKATGAVGILAIRTPNNRNIVDIVATKLDFVTQPNATEGINQPVVPSRIEARDQFGLRDKEFNFPATISAGAIPTQGFAFTKGVLITKDMQYQNTGDGTLSIDAGGLSSDVNNTVGGLTNDAINSTPVDVIHVTASYAGGGVTTSTNLIGGSTGAVIYGVTFTSEGATNTQPFLKGFTISFSNPISGVLANLKVYESLSPTYSVGLTEVRDPAIGGLVTAQPAFPNTNSLVIDFPPTKERDLSAGGGVTERSYFLVVDIDQNASGSTPSVQPSVSDGGYGTGTDGNIVTSAGTAKSSPTVAGNTYTFASIFPPILTSSAPAKGQLNVNPDQSTISLTFSVKVWTLDSKIVLTDQMTGSSMTLNATNGAYANGDINNLTSTLVFAIPPALPFRLKPDHVYYVTIAQGNQAKGDGIMDQNGNVYGGISYPGTLYFKTAKPFPPNLLGTLTTPSASSNPTISNISTTGAVITATFDQRGTAFYMILPAGSTPAPTVAQIGGAAYGPATVYARGSFPINQTVPISQSGVVTPSVPFVAGQLYEVWMFAQSDALPLPGFTTSAPYGSAATNFAIGGGGPTIVFPGVVPLPTSALTWNNPSMTICNNSYQILSAPIVITEGLKPNPDDFYTGTAGTSQAINLVLPAGFQFDVTLIAGKPAYGTLQLLGGDFGGTSGSLSFLGNGILKVTFANNAKITRDRIIISGLRVISSGSTTGSIFRLGGSAIPGIGDQVGVANLTSYDATAIGFNNSYSSSLTPTPTNIVTSIPDNANPATITLSPTTATGGSLFAAGDYGPTSFSGQGVNINVLTLSAVSLDAPFNITVNHTDNNGCNSVNTIQYTVYNHNTALNITSALLPAGVNIPENIYCAKNDNFVVDEINSPTYDVHTRYVDYRNQAAFYMDSLTAAIPSGVTQIITKGTAWDAIIKSLPKKLSGYTVGVYTFYDYSFDDAKIADANALSGGVLADPYSHFRSTITSTATGKVVTYYSGGSLGVVDLTGWFQSRTNSAVKVPRVQRVEFFLPAVPIIDASLPSKIDSTDISNPYGVGNPGTFVYCAASGLINITARPAAVQNQSTGAFKLYDADTGTLLTPGGSFTDNGNGSASLDPSLFANSYKNIRVEYTFHDDRFSTCQGAASQIIRITPNPIANFTWNSVPGALTGPNISDPTNSFCINNQIHFDANGGPNPSQIAAPGPTTPPTPANTILGYAWDFGDVNGTPGATGSNPNQPIIPAPNHVFSAAQNYSVSLTITSNWGCSSVPFGLTTVMPKVVSLPVGGIPSIKYKVDGVSKADAFRFNSNSTNVKFSAIGTNDPLNNTLIPSTIATGDGIKKYEWVFGDPSANVVVTGLADDAAFNSHVVTHNNYPIGVHTIDLIVTSKLGCIDSLSNQTNYHSLVVLDKQNLDVDPLDPNATTPSYVSDFASGKENWQVWGTGKSVAEISAGTASATWEHGPTPSDTPPDPTIGAQIWGTNINKTYNPDGTYNPFERSALYSPVLDLSTLKRPMISFSSVVRTIKSDGVVLQYSTDDLNIADPQKLWVALGVIGDGQDWFTDQGIAGRPGNQGANDFGWSGIDGSRWLSSRHVLDAMYPDKVAPLDSLPTKAVFRWAIGSASGNIQPEAKGFDLTNVRIGDRTRTILLESFASTSNAAAVEKANNDWLKTFTGTNLNNQGIGTEVVKINYHLGFPGKDPFNDDNPADPSSRALLYNVVSTPQSILDGEKDSQGRQAKDWVQPLYNLRTLQLAQAHIYITSSAQSAIDGSRVISAGIKATVTGGIPPNTIIHIGILEESIPFTSLNNDQKGLVKTGETSFEYVLKRMLPTAAGTRLGSLTGGNRLANNDSVTLSMKYIPEINRLYGPTGDLSVAVFLQQENSPYEIYQVDILRNITEPTLVTGLEPILAESIIVYPIPSNQEMNIALPGQLVEKANVQLIDQIGRVVHISSIDAGAESKVISTSDLAAGVYILQLEIGTGNFTRKKIVIAH